MPTTEIDEIELIEGDQEEFKGRLLSNLNWRGLPEDQKRDVATKAWKRFREQRIRERLTAGGKALEAIGQPVIPIAQGIGRMASILLRPGPTRTHELRQQYPELARLANVVMFSADIPGRYREEIEAIPIEERQTFIDLLLAQGPIRRRGPVTKTAGAFSRGLAMLWQNLADLGRLLAIEPPEVTVWEGIDPELEAQFEEKRAATSWFRRVTDIQQGVDPIRGQNLVSQGFYSAIQMTPQMGSGIAATMAAGPVGGVAFWWTQTAPKLYADLRNHGIDGGIAEPAAMIGAIPSAMVELLQAKMLLPPQLRTGVQQLAARTTREAVRRIVSQGVREYSREVLEEGVQSMIESTTKAIAAHLDENAPGVDWSTELKQAAKEMGEAAKAMPFLMAPGRIAQISSDFSKGEIYAKEIPEAETEIPAPGEAGGEGRGVRREDLQRAEETRTEAGRAALPPEAVEEEVAAEPEALPRNIFQLRRIARERGVDVSDIKGEGAVDRTIERLQAAPAESAAQRAAREAEAAPEVERRGAGIVLPGMRERARGPDVVPAEIQIEDAEVEGRIEAAHGLPIQTTFEKARDFVVSAWHRMTRAQEFLPGTEQFGTARELFRLLQDVPDISVDQVQRNLAVILDTLAGPNQRALFERKILADNQLRALDLDQPLRHGFRDRAQVEAYRAKLDEQIARTPEVAQALETRRALVRELVGQAVELNLLPEAAAENAETYMHQQVLMYQELNRRAGRGARKFGKTRRPFQRKRVTGVESLSQQYDPNTNYLESEFTWMLDAEIEIRKARLADDLINTYDISDEAKAEAEEAGLDDWTRIEREGYTTWAPPAGHPFYRAFSLPDRILEVLQEQVCTELGIPVEQQAMVATLNGPVKRVMIPVPLAKQLSAMRKGQPNVISEAAAAIMRQWKRWTLLQPKRAFQYNVRNLTGDLDPVIAGAPGILKSLADKNLLNELWRYYHGFLALSPQLEAARDHGVMSASLTAQEIPNLRENQLFRRLYADQNKLRLSRLPQQYFEDVKRLTEFRESLLRYAAFRYYLDAFNTGRPIRHWGASRKADVLRIQNDLGNEAAAAHMSRDLLGDYGNVTVLGDWLRTRLIPFWSFQEINLRRYPLIFWNAWQAGEIKGMLGAPAQLLYRGLLMSRSAWLYGAMALWNRLFFPEEEDDLGGYERDNPHIVLGRNSDGTVRVFRNAGAIGDYMEWFGLNTLIALYPQYASGQLTAGDLAKAIAKAPMNKLVQSIAPQYKTTYEVLGGITHFPDVFNPRSIDRWEALWASMGLQDEARALRGAILRDGMRGRPHWTERIFYGVVDPRKTALWEILDLRRRFLDKEGVDTTGIYARSKIAGMREAAVNGDYDAFIEAKRRYVEGGNTYKQFVQAARRLDPLAGQMNRKRRRKFEQEYLDSLQKKKLAIARDFAQQTRVTMVNWWWRQAQETK